LLTCRKQSRDDLALTAAELDHTPGRTWRNLQDTADAAAELYFSPQAWESWRRSVDFYDEGTLELALGGRPHSPAEQGHENNRRFLPSYFTARPARGPMVKTYTFDDVIDAL
jgi:hypothetical protein